MILLAMFALWSSPLHWSWPWWAWVVVGLAEWGNAILRVMDETSKMKKESLKLQNILQGKT